MQANPEMEGIVALPAPIEAPAAEPVVTPEPEPIAAPELIGATPVAKSRRVRPAWFATAIVGATAVIASGALGYDAYAASRQRDDLHARLVSTTSTLASTRNDLSAAQADAASKKLTADYVALYVADAGKVQTDYQSVVACTNYSSCRTATQQLLVDLQAFQSDRKLATVPSALSASDSSLGDALSAAIAGDQELIDGMDNDSTSKITDGAHKVDAAMLNVAKAESALGSELR